MGCGVENELADGEDDEKRIQRADIRAGKSLSRSRGLKKKKEGSGPQSSKKTQHVSAQARRGPVTRYPNIID